MLHRSDARARMKLAKDRGWPKKTKKRTGNLSWISLPIGYITTTHAHTHTHTHAQFTLCFPSLIRITNREKIVDYCKTFFPSPVPPYSQLFSATPPPLPSPPPIHTILFPFLHNQNKLEGNEQKIGFQELLFCGDYAEPCIPNQAAFKPIVPINICICCWIGTLVNVSTVLHVLKIVSDYRKIQSW